jgi:hypothetical protein
MVWVKYRTNDFIQIGFFLLLDKGGVFSIKALNEANVGSIFMN